MNTFLKLSVSFLVLVNFTVVGYTQSQGQHISRLNEFVLNFQEGIWKDSLGNSLDAGMDIPYPNRFDRGLREGYVHISDQSPKRGVSSSPSSSSYARTIDVSLNNNRMDDRHEVRGVFHVTLPELKRIQLELSYDLILDAGETNNPLEFFVEIYERDPRNGNEWFLSDTLREREDKKQRESQYILELSNEERQTNERFTSHSYIANITQWAGKEMQIALVSATSTPTAKTLKDRWIEARLVGSTFDFKIVPIPKQQPEDRN